MDTSTDCVHENNLTLQIRMCFFFFSLLFELVRSESFTDMEILSFFFFSQNERIQFGHMRPSVRWRCHCLEQFGCGDSTQYEFIRSR